MLRAGFGVVNFAGWKRPGNGVDDLSGDRSAALIAAGVLPPLAARDLMVHLLIPVTVSHPARVSFCPLVICSPVLVVKSGPVYSIRVLANFRFLPVARNAKAGATPPFLLIVCVT